MRARVTSGEAEEAGCALIGREGCAVLRGGEAAVVVQCVSTCMHAFKIHVCRHNDIQAHVHLLFCCGSGEEGGWGGDAFDWSDPALGEVKSKYRICVCIVVVS